MNDPVPIHIVLVSLQAPPAMVDRLSTLLDGREQAAAIARRGDGARVRYVVAHAALRVVIGERLGIDPSDLRIDAEAGGRPIVDGVGFSLSHSGDRAAIAIAPGGVRVGVDVERVRPRRHEERLARRVFTPAELEAWGALAPAPRTLAFTTRWTELESLLKARGTGIAGGLASAIAVPPGWSRESFDAGAGFVGSVAADAATLRVTTREFRFE